MVHALRIHEYGGPEVLTWEEVEMNAPGPGELLIIHHAVGLNYIDIYTRTGVYPQDSLPFVNGMEGAGAVLAIGEDITNIDVGDRVAYAGPIGAYAEERIVPANRVVKIPDAITFETAAAMMLKGMTASYLLNRTYKVGPETTILFHAVAGGVGLIACEWAAHLGATIIGTVGSDEKAAIAQTNGCTHTINYNRDDFVERVNEITKGEGVDVVYDAVGEATFPGSLDCLKPMGSWVSFGQSSGPTPDFNVGLLGEKGSLFATRPSLFTYTAKRDDLVSIVNDLFYVVEAGHVTIPINQTYALKDAATAHTDLEARKTTGTTILIP